MVKVLPLLPPLLALISAINGVTHFVNQKLFSASFDPGSVAILVEKRKGVII
jgi:hypothetical protein